jgi:hypothetical protein
LPGTPPLQHLGVNTGQCFWNYSQKSPGKTIYIDVTVSHTFAVIVFAHFSGVLILYSRILPLIAACFAAVFVQSCLSVHVIVRFALAW